MLKLETNKIKNQLFIKLEGFIQNEKVGEYANECKIAIASLKSGFTIITDISGLKPSTQESIWVAREIMELINNSQPRKIIRIVGNNILTKNQFKRAWKNAYINYNVVEVESYEEALIEASKT
jgi:hypothetical protein